MNKILFGLSMGMLAGVCAAQIPMSNFVRTFTSSTRVRGFYFQAPVDFTVTHLQVPDESGKGDYAVALYNMKGTMPPAFSATISPKPVAYSVQKSGDIYKLPTPAAFKKGDWFGVLGSAGTASSSSYGGANVASSVFGNAVVLRRFLTQVAMRGPKGAVAVSTENAGPIGRVRVYITNGAFSTNFGCPSSNGSASLSLSDPNPAIIGKSLGLRMSSGGTNNSGAILAVGVLRGNISVPGFGRLCLTGIVAIIPFGGRSIAAGNGTIQLYPVPKDPSLKGVTLPFQGALKTAAGALPLTNGFEITIGN